MIRSNSKLPFCATGESAPSSLDWPLLLDLGGRGLFGGTRVRPAPGILRGADGDATLVIIYQFDSQGNVEENEEGT